MPNLGSIVPNFQADTTQGRIDFHESIQDSYAILFSHPADFTPVCTTELSSVSRLANEFRRRNIKVFALSCDSVESHSQWALDVENYGGAQVFYPIIADPNRDIATLYGMLDPVAKDAAGIPLTCRAVFFIGPDKQLKFSILYPASTGRNFDEILRAIDSIITTSSAPIATPVDWRPGQDVIVAPSVSQEDAAERFPQHRVVDLPSGKSYLRFTPDPSVFLKMTEFTCSEAYPPNQEIPIVSKGHRLVRENLEKIKANFRPQYRGLLEEDLDEVRALHDEWFPIRYQEQFFQAMLQGTIEPIMAVLDPSYYNIDYPKDIIIGIAAIRISVNRDNDYLRFTYYFSTTYSGYIATLGVVEPLRGMGVAKALYMECLRKCLEHPMRPSILYLHVATYNKHAIAFYEKLGLQRVDLVRDYYYLYQTNYHAYVYLQYLHDTKPPVCTLI